MADLPRQYAWLRAEPGPRLLKEMLALYGAIETPGKADNPLILSWAKSIGLGSVYKHDSTAWCGLAMAYAAAQAGWEHAPRGNALWAQNWASWGNPVDAPMLGDVLVFTRRGGGHVGLYVGEDKACFHVIGGNQGDAVSIKRIARGRLFASRRCPWRVNQPANVRRIIMSSSGPISDNEA